MWLRYRSFLKYADREDKVYEGCVVAGAGAGAGAGSLAIGLDIR